MTRRPTLHQMRPAEEYFSDDESWEFEWMDPGYIENYEEREQPLDDIFVRSDGHGLIYDNRSHTFYGLSEAGKSFLVLKCVCDAIVAGRKVAFLDFEDAGRVEIAARLRAMGLPAKLIENLAYMAPKGPPDAASWGRCVQALDDANVSVVAIDAVAGALAQMGRSGQTADDFVIWQKAMVSPLLENHSMTVIMVDHAILNEKTGRGAGPSGSQQKRATVTGAEYRVKVIRPIIPGRIGILDLFVDKDKPGAVREFSGPRQGNGEQHAARVTVDAKDPENINISIDPPEASAEPGSSQPLGGADDAADDRASMAEIYKIIEAEPGINQNDICRAVGGDRNHVIDLTKRLASEGYIRRPGHRPGRAIPHTCIRPFVTDTPGA